jgi:hypothetical protein
MNSQKAHINTDLFARWFKEIFVPRKAFETNVLILDGHASNCNYAELLKFAKEDVVVALTLPSHITAAMQCLD